MAEIIAAEDQLLLMQAGGGNQNAFDKLYRKYWKFVYSAAYKRLSDHTYAADIAQDVFTQLWGQLSAPESPAIENLKAYLYIAVRNNVFKWMERERKYVPIPDLLMELGSQTGRADAQLLYEELNKAYQTLLECLPAQQQTIFRMRYQNDLSSEQIANVLNLSPKTVRNQLGRALQKIKTALLMTLFIWGL